MSEAEVVEEYFEDLKKKSFNQLKQNTFITKKQINKIVWCGTKPVECNNKCNNCE